MKREAEECVDGESEQWIIKEIMKEKEKSRDMKKRNDNRKNDNQRNRLLKQELKKIRNASERIGPGKENFLEEPYGSRRQRALLNYMDKAEEEFDPVGPRSVLQDFARQELAPLLNIHAIDYSFDLRIGAALWILDKLSFSGRLKDAYQFLPEVDFEFYALPPELYHPCYSSDLINSVVKLLTTRYAKDPNKRINENEGVILMTETATGRKPKEAYQKLLDLLPEEDVKKACADFKDKVWDLAVRRMKATGYYEREAFRLSQQNFMMPDQVKIPYVQPKNPFLNPSAVMGLSQMPEFNRMVDNAKIAQELSKKEVEINYYFSDYLRMSKREILSKTGSKEVAEAFSGFVVSDPYELCFALFYLLDSGDDAPWLVSSAGTLMDYCQRMLPWYLEEMEEWTEEEMDEWYFGNVYDRNGWCRNGTIPDQKDFFNERHGDKNLAQIIYKMCRGVVPAGLHPFEQDRKQLVEDGMDEETARFITGTADLLFLSQFQAKARTEEVWTDLVREAEEDDDVEETDDADDANDAESLVGTPSDLNEIQKLKKELSNALKQVKSYKNALAVARQDANSERAKYEHELKELRMEHRELADLRSLVFNKENADQERIEKVEKQYSYPYETKKRTVVFGGHDSFLRAFKPMFTNVKFVDAANLTYSPEIIRNADVVWIQNNCISHPQYWSIVKNCKRAGVQMRYFGFASAEKCAEQLVTEDLK